MYLTKDYGAELDQVADSHLATAGAELASGRCRPTTLPAPTTTRWATAQFAQGNYDVSLAIDPTNPNIVYLGGTADGNPVGHDPDRRDRRQRPARVLPEQRSPRRCGPTQLCHGRRDDRVVESRRTAGQFPFGFDARTSPVINLIRNPNNPQGASATVDVNNAAPFANTGAGVRWIPVRQLHDRHRQSTASSRSSTR